MPVVRQTKTKLSVATLPKILDSIGAHVASKLQEFGTDERTLTDELCDMFCIWAGRAATAKASRGRFEALIEKTTQQQEAEIGADFAVRVSTPSGMKRALMQAKVFDPHDRKLRCDSPAGWDKLWGQLVLMRQRNGDLSFLLIYVPRGLLNGKRNGFGTWEQGLAGGQPGTQTPSRLGATLIPVDALLDNANNWRYSTPVTHTGAGRFRPPGHSLTRVFLEMLACRRGTWMNRGSIDADGFQRNPDFPEAYPVRYGPSREIIVGLDEIQRDHWERLQREVRKRLDETEGELD